MSLPVESITLRNYLSFGGDTAPIELRDLNVIIGPNGSGKSNFVDAILFYSRLPRNLGHLMRYSGGAAQYFFRGVDGPEVRDASLELAGNYGEKEPFSHHITFTKMPQGYEITDETILLATKNGRLSLAPDFSYHNGYPRYKKQPGRRVYLNLHDVNRSQSVISIEQTYNFERTFWGLSRFYDSFGFYEARRFTQFDLMRGNQHADEPNGRLRADGSNLAVVLNRLMRERDFRSDFDRYMTDFYEGFESLNFEVQGGLIQLSLTESGLRNATPATRMSDGTVRWLSLLTILCDPKPPPLICIEEPETALHPDIIVQLATLLREAAKRTQLIITTHSDTLVDALHDTPESILVCERENSRTSLRRLDGAKLSKWLAKYGLGQLWRRGDIGGNRF